MKTTIANITDADGHLVAQVSRMRDFRDLDFVAIRHDDNVVCIEVTDMPEFLHALTQAMEPTQ